MFGIGLPELILIIIAALIFLGPEKLPDLAKSLGRAYTDLKRAGDELKKSIDEAVEPAEGGKGPVAPQVPKDAPPSMPVGPASDASAEDNTGEKPPDHDRKG